MGWTTYQLVQDFVHQQYCSLGGVSIFNFWGGTSYYPPSTNRQWLYRVCDLSWLLYLDFGAKLQVTCFCSSHVDHSYLKAWTTTSTSSKFSGGHLAGAWYFHEELGCISTLSGIYRNLLYDFRSIWTPKLWQRWFQTFETSICIWKYLKTLSGEWYSAVA